MQCCRGWGCSAPFGPHCEDAVCSLPNPMEQTQDKKKLKTKTRSGEVAGEGLWHSSRIPRRK